MARERGGRRTAAVAALGRHDMMLRIGNRNFDWWTFGLRSVEHRCGLVALVARHNSDEVEVLDAIVTDDMNDAAQRFVEDGRLRVDYPGVVVGVVTLGAGRTQATHIAEVFMRRRWLRAVETDGSERREVVSWCDLADMASESARRALGLR